MNHECTVKTYISSFLRTDNNNVISDDKFKLMFYPK